MESEKEFLLSLLDAAFVEESEKESLLSLLDTTPAEEVEASTKMSSPKPTKTTEFCVTPATRSTVEEFAHTHPVWHYGTLLGSGNGSDWIDEKMSQFKSDVYKYARAAGMGKNQAKVEVMRAVAAWRKENGVGGAEVLEEWESDIEMEIYASSPALSAKAPVPFANSGAMETKKSKKRKRKNVEGEGTQVFPSQVDLAEKKRLRKAARTASKKERRKAARDLNEEQSGYDAVTRTEQKMDDQDPPTEIPVNKPATKREKAKQGPTTSSYFAKSLQPPAPHPKQGHTVMADHAANFSDSSKRAKKRRRAEDQMASGSTIAESVSAALEHGTPEFESVSAIFDEGHISEDTIVKSQEKKHKRKHRKRNKNSLPDDELVAARVHAAKRPRTGEAVENPATYEDEGLQHVSEICENDGEDLEDEPKVKGNGRRKRRSDKEQAMFDELQQPLSNPHDIEFLIDDHLVEVNDSQFDLEAVEEKREAKQSSSKQRRDRGRKVKGKKNEDSKPTTQESPEHQPLDLSLTELANTNIKQRKQRSGDDRGRGRRRESDKRSEMDVDTQSSGEQSKVRHS